MKNILIATVAIMVLLIPACGKTPNNEVVIYNALDEVFSGPILKDFETTTGIKVKMLTDTEAVKTVGLVTRLIEEKDNPQADVFWNNEIGWTLVMKQKGMFESYQAESARNIPDTYKDKNGFWTGFAARARVILYNTSLVQENEVPQSILDFTKPIYKGRVAIARPVVGTMATHAAALFVNLGEAETKKFFIELKANDCKIVAGNMMAAKMVANGEIAICLTDTDDANGMMLDNKPVKMVYPDQSGMGALVLPNSIALIKGGPNQENGKKLIEYILKAETEQKLAKLPSAQMPLRAELASYSPMFNLASIKIMAIDYNKLADWLESSKKFIYDEFLK
ncbi:MAG: extracellular solute-binding protein [Candidatus Brocadiia bacterium]